MRTTPPEAAAAAAAEEEERPTKAARRENSVMETNAHVTWREKKLQKRECRLMAHAESESFLHFRPASEEAKQASAALAALAALAAKRAKDASGERGDFRLERLAKRRAAESEYLRRCDESCAIAIDLGFAGLMTLKEEKSLVQQVFYSYGAIKQAPRPCRMHLCACEGGSRVETGLRALSGFGRWPGVVMHPTDTPLEACVFDEPGSAGGVEGAAAPPPLPSSSSSSSSSHLSSAAALAPPRTPGQQQECGAAGTDMSGAGDAGDATKCDTDEGRGSGEGGGGKGGSGGEGGSASLSRLVYLTSDSPNTLSVLEPGKVYVIGGIVDRNRHKRATIARAEELGMAHAKLPLAEHAQERPKPGGPARTTSVLTVNHVVQIMVHWLTHRDWARALSMTLPTRGDRLQQPQQAQQRQEGKRQHEERAQRGEAEG